MMEEASGRGKVDICAFCRAPTPTSEGEEVKRTKKLMKADNADAFHQFAGFYVKGNHGMPQDMTKANELLLKAGELGCAEAYFIVGSLYNIGRGVEIDKKKAIHFFELAAMNGEVYARHYLGCMEKGTGNYHRAMKHFVLCARSGYKDS